MLMTAVYKMYIQLVVVVSWEVTDGVETRFLRHSPNQDSVET